MTGSKYDDIVKLQKETAKKVLATDQYGRIELVCGVDVSYSKNKAHCSAVITNGDLQVVESVGSSGDIEHPYIPGLFMLRESGPILRTLKLLKNSYDLLLIDGHGQLHPRKCGLACYIGVTLNKPTIGVAKSLLCGTVREDSFVELGGQVLGVVIGKGRKKLYVSVGHMISLESAAAIVQKLIKDDMWMPEPLRLADALSKKERDV